MYLGYIRAAIRNKKIFTLLSIIQITITIILIIEVLVKLSTINYKSRELKSELNLDLNKTYQFIVYGNDQGKSDFKKELSNYVDIGSYRYENSVIKEIINNEKFINMFGVEDESAANGIPLLKMDKNLFDLLNINIVSGRSLNETDFELKNDKIPIIFSETYKNIVNIGDTITAEGISTKIYEVVGFYDKSVKWMPPNGIEFFGLEDLGKMGVTIHSQEEKEFPLYEQAINSSTYITSDKLNKNEVENIVKDANEKYGLNVEVLSITDILNRFKKENYPLIMQTIFFSIFMVISSCVGLTSNISFTIINRKREFGIRLANGFRKKDIKLLLLSEMLFITLISTMIAMTLKLFEVYRNKQISISEKILIPQFNSIDFVISILLVGVILGISAIVPLKNIDKLQPKEMIGGID